MIVKMTSIKLYLGIVVAEELHLQQLDVKTVFLHDDLDKDIYMAQPEGFHMEGKKKLVCASKKSMYGLKQVQRQWYLKVGDLTRRSGYMRCNMDHCCYFKKI